MLQLESKWTATNQPECEPASKQPKCSQCWPASPNPPTQMHSCWHECTPVYKSAAETRMNSRQNELRATNTNRDAMQCKAMQYGMQYYPMLWNAIQCARSQWWTESQTRAVSQEAGYIWTTCLWTNFEAETGDCFKHTNARGHLKGKDCHRILFSSFWWGEGPTTQGTTFFVAFMYESSVLHICCCLSSFLCCVSSFLFLFIISTLLFFTACCSSPIRCCSWSWLTARVENRCGDHIIPIGRIAILQNMCTPFSSESHWHWSFNLNILLIHIWTIGQ